MADRKMPNPVSVGDEYLKAILEELKGLRADQARAPEPKPVTEFREPAPKKRQSTRRGKG